MGVQDKVSQLISTAAGAAAIGKHIANQNEANIKAEEANELAKGKEIVELNLAKAEAESKELGLKKEEKIDLQENPAIGTPAGEEMIAEGNEDLEMSVKALGVRDKKLAAIKLQKQYIDERLNKLKGGIR